MRLISGMKRLAITSTGVGLTLMLASASAARERPGRNDDRAGNGLQR